MVILIAVFPLNWAAGLILMITAPLVPIFMILVGIAAADSSQKNMATLSRLSAQFLDRLRGLRNLTSFQPHFRNKLNTLKAQRKTSVKRPWLCLEWRFSLLPC